MASNVSYGNFDRRDDEKPRDQAELKRIANGDCAPIINIYTDETTNPNITFSIQEEKCIICGCKDLELSESNLGNFFYCKQCEFWYRVVISKGDPNGN